MEVEASTSKGEEGEASEVVEEEEEVFEVEEEATSEAEEEEDTLEEEAVVVPASNKEDEGVVLEVRDFANFCKKKSVTKLFFRNTLLLFPVRFGSQESRRRRSRPRGRGRRHRWLPWIRQQ